MSARDDELYARGYDDAKREDADLIEQQRAELVGLREQLARQAPNVTGETSDGHHTFDELYEYRLLYNAALFNELARNPAFVVHKSWRHSDGELCFGGGWFIVFAQLPTGQITNHYKADEWSLFKISATATAAEWDGHDPAEVARRLRSWLTGPVRALSVPAPPETPENPNCACDYCAARPLGDT